MEYKDYYKILGLERDASEDDIKKAYRRMARKYHPDVSKEADADDRFKEANEAYEVLKDPEKRAAYDRIDPERARAQTGFQPPPGWDHGFDFSGSAHADPGADGSTFSDFFESLFGRGFAGARSTGGTRRSHGFGQGFGQGFGPRRGQDHIARVELDLEDAFTGGRRRVTLRSPEVNELGQTVERSRSLNVTIPKGVREGQQLRLAGQAKSGNTADTPGDLLLEIGFKPHPLYTLDGSDLILELPVAPWEAALGATVKAPTPAGAVDLRIPPNSRDGKRLRLRGRGMPGKTPGDLYAVLRIALPPADSDKARAVYERMAHELDFNPRARLGV
ncbi:heat shock protein DnaJ domain-containing protein [Salinisphaera sp. T5B8]|uniref:DnaJ C-terminal domain-containing protein n=1 Tax=unclassified Salinisphaera TaxID=2649847 RepID=UPI0033400317